MLNRIHNLQDFLAGLMFAAIGVLVLSESADLQFGSLVSMGPGFFPVVLAWMLLAFATAMIIRSILGARRSSDLMMSRRALAIVAATVGFGLLVGPLGFVPALLVLVCVSSVADPDLSWPDTGKLAVGLCIGSVVIFVFLLKQPIALFGPFLTAF